jgi:flagellar basal-body rod modification protein FlgD
MSAIPATSNTENLYVSSSDERNAAETAARAAQPDRVSHQDFLKLLTAQLTHQDPLNPIQDTEFTAQIAQLQALDEQIRATDAIVGLQRGSDLAAGSSLLGRLVSGKDRNGLSTVGTVDNVVVRDEEVFLQLSSGQLMALADLSEMTYVDDATGEQLRALQAASGLIGRVVTGVDAEGGDLVGIVRSATVRDGTVLVELDDGTEMLLDAVGTVHDIPMDAETFARRLEVARDLVGAAVIGTDPGGTDREGTVHGVGLENGAIVLNLTTGSRVLLTSVPGALEDS